jgi:hypothetical protein
MYSYPVEEAQKEELENIKVQFLQQLLSAIDNLVYIRPTLNVYETSV